MTSMQFSGKWRGNKTIGRDPWAVCYKHPNSHLGILGCCSLGHERCRQQYPCSTVRYGRHNIQNTYTCSCAYIRSSKERFLLCALCVPFCRKFKECGVCKVSVVTLSHKCYTFSSEVLLLFTNYSPTRLHSPAASRLGPFGLITWTNFMSGKHLNLTNRPHLETTTKSSARYTSGVQIQSALRTENPDALTQGR